MKTVKLYFTGFWEDFDNENNLFTRILRQYRTEKGAKNRRV